MAEKLEAYGKGPIHATYTVDKLSEKGGTKYVSLRKGPTLELPIERSRSSLLDRLVGEKINLTVRAWPPTRLKDMSIKYDGTIIYPLTHSKKKSHRQ